jgi:methylenetetrahydrofolate dehydrogenase (NADP+)/methenyltetrahydrofolate cyclohydrolase
MLVDGVAIALQARANLKKLIGDRQPPLGLAAIVVGDDPGLKTFVKLKKKVADELGVLFSVYEFKEAEVEDLKKTMAWLAQDDGVHGIFVELPLPVSISQEEILGMIPESKDVDVISSALQKKYYANDILLLPPAVGALDYLFENLDVDVKGKKVAVFGQGMLVGQPITHWLKKFGAEVSVIDEHTKNSEDYSLKADIVISGVGKPGLITGDMITDKAIVVDYGYSPEGKGDVHLESVVPKAAVLTPVPGGMGPLVIAATFANLVALAMK